MPFATGVDRRPFVTCSLWPQVSASLLGAVPKEFCRDAPPAAIEAMEMGQDNQDRSPDNRTVGRGFNASATIVERSQINSAPTDGGGSFATALQFNNCRSTLPRSPRLRQRLQEQQKSPSYKQQRGAPIAVISAGDEKGTGDRNRQERSRRRLAAFLEKKAALSEAPLSAPVPAVDHGVGRYTTSPRSPGLGAARSGGDGHRGGERGGVLDGNTRFGL